MTVKPSPVPALFKGDSQIWLRAAAPDHVQLDVSGGRTADDRKEQLRRAQSGEICELDVTAIVFIEGPNRNSLRFEPTILPSLAASFAGVPVLRDHDTGHIEARCGTVTASELVTLADGRRAIRARFRLTKRWAIVGVLDGTIDRFSIGTHPTGPILCSLHRTPILEKCSCWAGDPIKDSADRVEFIVTAADGVELSIVNVPAVVGTNVEEIHLQANARALASLAAVRTGRTHPAAFGDVDRAALIAYEAALETYRHAITKYERDHAQWQYVLDREGFSPRTRSNEPQRPTPPVPPAQARPALASAKPNPQFDALVQAAMTRPIQAATAAATPQEKTKMKHDLSTDGGRLAAALDKMDGRLKEDAERAGITTARQLGMILSMQCLYSDSGQDRIEGAVRKHLAALQKGGF